MIRLVLLLAWFAALPAFAEFRVVAVNYPLAYFAERIGGAAINVELPVPPDIDPADWAPDAITVARMQSADLILLNGVGYAGWETRTSMPRQRTVDTTRPFDDRLLPAEAATVHTHGPTGSHQHRQSALTTWLDFTQAANQATTIRDALIRELPESTERFEQAHDDLIKQLAQLDQQLLALTETHRDTRAVASHPVYQYLARRYGLDVRAMHWEAEVLPDDAQWYELARLLERHPSRLMLWEGAPAPASVARLDGLEVTSVVFDPCANRPAEGDFMSVMQRNVRSLGDALR